VTRFDDVYFDRLADRIEAAGRRGIYVSVMLFNGWSVGRKAGAEAGNPWLGHPFNGANNVNGVDGDSDRDGEGFEVHTLALPQIVRLQERYVQHIVDVVNGFDNVLFEICNECATDSWAWQEHMVRVVRRSELAKPKHHPVGLTVPYPRGENSALFRSSADWVSPNPGPRVARLIGKLIGPPARYLGWPDSTEFGSEREDPPARAGSKVIVADTDHLWGLGGSRAWVWKSVLRGRYLLFMDPYDGRTPGLGNHPDYRPEDPQWNDLRRNIGYARQYASRLDLARAVPRDDLTTSPYCLASVGGRLSALLTYLPSGGRVRVNLAEFPGENRVEWFDPATGHSMLSGSISGGGLRWLTSPYGGDAVLYIERVRQ